MFHAVLLYSDIPNPEGVPSGWPAEVRDLGESVVLPTDGRPWRLMTSAQLQTQFDANQTAKDTWQAAKDNAAMIAEAQRATAIELARTNLSANLIMFDSLTDSQRIALIKDLIIVSQV